MFSLKISERGGSTEVRTFEKPEVSIGRIQGNDIVLPKGNISKRHARIVNRDNDFVVVDLRSTNGTYVNGQRVTSPMVVSGEDKLYIGDFIIQVARGDASAEADVQPPDETRALDFDDEIAVIEEPASSPGVSSPEQPLALDIAEEADDGELPETVEATAEPLHAPAAVHEPAHAEETAEAPRAAAPAAASPAEAYAHALRLFHDRAKRSVFAGLDLDNIDFDSQWHELERAVYSLVERGRQSGEIGEHIDAAALTTDILYEFTALGPIEYFLADDDVSEIHVGAHNLIFVRRGGTVELDDQKAFSSPRRCTRPSNASSAPTAHTAQPTRRCSGAGSTTGRPSRSSSRRWSPGARRCRSSSRRSRCRAPRSGRTRAASRRMPRPGSRRCSATARACSCTARRSKARSTRWPCWSR